MDGAGGLAQCGSNQNPYTFGPVDGFCLPCSPTGAPSVVANVAATTNMNHCGGGGFCYAVTCSTPTTCSSTVDTDAAGDPDFDACASTTLDLSSATACEAILTAATDDADDATACTYSAGDSTAGECVDGYYVSGGACTPCTTVTNAATVACTSGSDSTATSCTDGFYTSLRVVEACTVTAGTAEEESAAATTCDLTAVNHEAQTAGRCDVATGSGGCEYVAPATAGASCETCPSVGEALTTVCVSETYRRANSRCWDANGWDDGVCASAQNCPTGKYPSQLGSSAVSTSIESSGMMSINECTACGHVDHALVVSCTSSSDEVATSCKTDFHVTEQGTCACDAGKYLTTDYAPDPDGSVMIGGEPHALIGSCPDCSAVTNAATVACSSSSNSVPASCNSGFVLESGACVCADGTYDDGNGACATCASRAPDSGACACSAGTYDDSSGGCATCATVTNAATVTCVSSDTSVAASCNQPYAVSGDACACPAGTYDDGAGGCQTCGTVDNAQSVACSSDSDQVATVCNFGFELTTAGACACQSGTYLDEITFGPPARCTTCGTVTGAATVTCTGDSDSVPVTCNQGYTLSNGECACTCESGFWASPGTTCTCNPCRELDDQMGRYSTATLTCSSSSNSVAATCNDGYVLVDAACACPEGAEFDDRIGECVTPCTPLEGDCVCPLRETDERESDGCRGCLRTTNHDMMACVVQSEPDQSGPDQSGPDGQDVPDGPDGSDQGPPARPEPTCTAGAVECVCTPAEGATFREMVQANMAGGDNDEDFSSDTFSASCTSCLTGRNPMETVNLLEGANTDPAFLSSACTTEMAACEDSQTCMTYIEVLRKLHSQTPATPLFSFKNLLLSH